MVDQTRRRNRAAVHAGHVQLVQADAASIPWRDAAFTGVLAVNSMQLWEPLDLALRRGRARPCTERIVGRRHPPSGVEKRAPVREWIDMIDGLLASWAVADITHRTAPFPFG